MSTAFSLLGEILGTFLALIPRLLVTRATHGGVKWKRGKIVKEIKPGLSAYWPLVTDIEIVPTARQTLNLVTQVVTTKDNKKVSIGTVVVYRIKDVVQAIGRINWDVDATVNDITQAAIVSSIAGHKFSELLSMVAAEGLNDLLTEATRKELDKFGVFVFFCKLTDFSECRVFKILLDSGGTAVRREE